MLITEKIEYVAYLLKDYREVSPDLFQTMLSVDFYTARDIFRELVKLGILYDVHRDESEEENFIPIINKKKIKELTAN